MEEVTEDEQGGGDVTEVRERGAEMEGEMTEVQEQKEAEKNGSVFASSGSHSETMQVH